MTADGWMLDAVLKVLPGSGEHARLEVLRTLASVDHDWKLERRESRWARAVLGDVTWSPELETSPPSGDGEHGEAILEILRAVAAYLDVLDRTDGGEWLSCLCDTRHDRQGGTGPIPRRHHR